MGHNVVAVHHLGNISVDFIGLISTHLQLGAQTRWLS
jgi:hypothetical protein